MMVLMMVALVAGGGDDDFNGGSGWQVVARMIELLVDRDRVVIQGC